MAVRLSRVLAVQIADRIKTITDKTGDGYVEYRPGHSDKSVAEHFAVTEAGVRGVRADFLGLIRPARTKRESTLEDRVLILEKEVDELRLRLQRAELAIEEMRKAVNAPRFGEMLFGAAQP
jgi:hypothetical protein